MSFINRAQIDDATSKVEGVGVATPTAPEWGVLAGTAFSPGAQAVATIETAPGVGDPASGSFRLTNDDRLYIWPVETLGVPSLVVWNSGLPYVPDGRLVVSTAAVANYVAGWPVTIDGWVCMNVAGTVGTGEFDMSIPGPTTNTVFTTTIVNSDTYSLTKITFDLSNTFSFAPGFPALVFGHHISQVNGTITTATPFGTAGGSTFGFDFTGFTTGKTFVFTWDAHIATDPAYVATVLEVDLTTVSIVTSAGPAVDSYMQYSGISVESGWSHATTPSPA